MDEASQIHEQTRPPGSVLTDQEREVVAAHLPLLKKLSKKYKGYGFPDLFAQFSQIACEIVPAWDSRRGTFGALLKFALPKRILNMARDRSRRPRETPETDLADDDGGNPISRRVDHATSPEANLIHQERVAIARKIRQHCLATDRRRYPSRAHVGRPIEVQVAVARRWLTKHRANLGRFKPAKVYATEAGVEVAAMSTALRAFVERDKPKHEPRLTQLSFVSN